MTLFQQRQPDEFVNGEYDGQENEYTENCHTGIIGKYLEEGPKSCLSLQDYFGCNQSFPPVAEPNNRTRHDAWSSNRKQIIADVIKTRDAAYGHGFMPAPVHLFE